MPHLVTRETELSVCTGGTQGGTWRVTECQGQRLTFLHFSTAFFKQKTAADVPPPRGVSTESGAPAPVPTRTPIPVRRSSALSVNDRSVTWLPVQHTIPGCPWLCCSHFSCCVLHLYFPPIFSLPVLRVV